MAQHHTNDGAIRLAPDMPSRGARLAGFPQPPPWMGEAICTSTDPEAFFPEKGGSTKEAKQICAGCPVQFECLDYALINQEGYGIWGGVSERGRRRLSGRQIRANDPDLDDDFDQQEQA